MHGCITLLIVLSVPVLQAVGAEQSMPSPVAVLLRVERQKPLTSAAGDLDPDLPVVPITPPALIQVLLLLAAVLQFATSLSSPLWPSLVALVVTWAHTRFFRPPPKRLELPSTSGDADTATIVLRGDRSDGLQFVKLFPEPVRAAVSTLAGPVAGVCLRWRVWNLPMPQRSENERRDGQAAADALFSFSGEGAGGADGGSSSGFVGLGAAGYTTATSGSGFAGSNTAVAAASVRDPVAERRRARALQLLDAKLAQMGSGTANAAPAPAKVNTSTGGVGATDSSDKTDAAKLSSANKPSNVAAKPADA